MDMYQALRSRLLAGAPLVALVSDRVDWDIRPQGKPLPAITLQVITDPDTYHYEGVDDLRSTLVQIDIWALDRAMTVAIKKVALSLVQPAWTGDGIRFEHAFVDGNRDSTETVNIANQATQTVFRTSVDLRVWSAPIS